MPYQFAYCSGRSTAEDASLLLDTILRQHEDTLGNYTRVYFMDLSSAFNTICCLKLLQSMSAFVNPNNILPLYNSLSDRTQYLHRIEGISSAVVVANTGITPAIYTDSFRSQYNVYVRKYADDTAIIGLCNNRTPLYVLLTIIKQLFILWTIATYLSMIRKQRNE